ncbi:putative ataxin-3 [Chlorella vulgaris]
MEEGDRADLVYFESQQAALCGVHAVNTLLQAPHFSEVDMAQIAHELDAAENALMASGGMDNPEYLQYVAEGSSNVAENGMFSIQVLSRALEIFGLQAIPLSSPDMAPALADPTTQQAFLCNQQEHWLTVRRIHDQYWNLNSIYTAPEPLSTFYLSAFLGSLQQQGYTIFVVVGELPPSQPPAASEERSVPGQAGRWFTPEEARAATQEREELKKKGYVQALAQKVADKASGGTGSWLTLRRPGDKRSLQERSPQGGGDSEGEERADASDLARALAASLADGDASGGGSSRFGGGSAGAAADDEDADLAAAIAASLADGHGPGSRQQQQQEGQMEQQQQVPGSPRSVAAGFGGEAQDPELAAAIAASLDPPREPSQPQQLQQQPQQDQDAATRLGQATPLPVPVQETAAAAAPQSSAQLPELQAEPEAGLQGVVEVALRLPEGGRRASRRFFASSDTVGHLAAFAAEQGADMSKCQLALQFPRAVLSDYGQSLEAAGVGNKQLVAVEPR